MILASTAAPAQVLGVHGTTGASWWKCFARGSHLAGAWEAVEWARVPAGGLSGEHVHTRTEEVYVILSGAGEILLDGVPGRVGPGDVVLTGLGTRHGLRNVGAGDLDWLVIELLAPGTAAVLGPGPLPPPARPLPPPTTIREETPMPGARVLQDLREPGAVDPGGVLTGPLRRLAREHLAPGRTRAVDASRREVTLFVLAGSGDLIAGDLDVPLGAGSSVTFPRGSAATVSATGNGLELFIAELAVELAVDPGDAP